MISKPKIIKFPNGATLIYQKQPSSTMSSISMGFVCGAKCDGEHKGISHLIEHLLYRGYSESKTIKLLDKLSDNIFSQNAFTSANAICMKFSTTNNNLEKALKERVETFKEKRFTKEQINKEIEVVKQEIKINQDYEEDIPETALDKLFDAIKESKIKPLTGLDILGNSKTLNSILPEHIVDYKSKYFNSKNLVISIATSLPLDVVTDMIEKEVISKFDYSSKKSVINSIPKNNGFKTNNFNMMILEPNTPSHNVQIDFLIKTDGYGDNYEKQLAYNMIEEFYLNSMNGEQFLNLRVKTPLVYYFDLKNHPSKSSTLKHYSITTSPVKTRKVMSVMCEMFSSLAQNGLEEKYFENYKQQIIEQIKHLNGSNSRLCESNFYKYVTNQTFTDYNKLISYVNKMTFEDFNNYIKSTYTNPKLSVSAEGLFDTRKMYRLVELEIMAGNTEHIENLWDYNNPVYEATESMDPDLEKIKDKFTKEIENYTRKKLGAHDTKEPTK